MEMVKGLNTDEEREQMWSNLASGIFYLKMGLYNLTEMV